MTVISRAPKLAFVQAHRYASHPHGYATFSGCSQPNDFLSSSCRNTAQSLTKLGYDVRLFTRQNLPPQHLVSPHTPVKGSTATVRILFKRTFPGVAYPNIDVPQELAKYARRKIVASTLGNVRARQYKIPYGTKFIKPLHKAKLFHGGDLRSRLWHIPNLPDHTPVAIHDYRDFRDEERFVVTPRGKVIPVFTYVVENEVANKKIERLQEFATMLHEAWAHVAPKCYIMDVGLSSKPDAERYYPTLVEINSVLTAGNMDDLQQPLPGRIVAAGWKSYARYGETGCF